MTFAFVDFWHSYAFLVQKIRLMKNLFIMYQLTFLLFGCLSGVGKLDESLNFYSVFFFCLFKLSAYCQTKCVKEIQKKKLRNIQCSISIFSYVFKVIHTHIMSHFFLIYLFFSLSCLAVFAIRMMIRMHCCTKQICF